MVACQPVSPELNRPAFGACNERQAESVTE